MANWMKLKQLGRVMPAKVEDRRDNPQTMEQFRLRRRVLRTLVGPKPYQRKPKRPTNSW